MSRAASESSAPGHPERDAQHDLPEETLPLGAGRASYPAAARRPAEAPVQYSLFEASAAQSLPAPAEVAPPSAPAPTRVDASPPPALRERAAERLHALWARCLPHLGRRRMTVPTLEFFRRRSDAGRAYPAEGRIALNEDLLERYPDAMLGETIAHELAHVLVHRLHGRRARAHGPEWQHVMRAWFDVVPERTHRFDVGGLGLRSQRRWTYRCDCRDHALSSVRHRRAMRGVDYRCTACHGSLRRADDRTPN